MKRFLMMTVGEVYGVFQAEYPDTNIGISKFYELRPEFVYLRKDFPHNMCLCRFHENVRLLLESLRKYTELGITVSFRGFIETVVCDQESEECMYGKCETCKGKFDMVYRTLISTFKPI